ncbi:MAG: 3-deoxy-7-phosphoheptulonate synthase [Bradyrhizobium sp.]|uniref:3-deoxy-7-phosphoheptulonate synthase n=1 Tax=Bradyrhizobium sp. TaxID=376 RepID=UPI001EB2C7EC|nr:3-deoxy-7-phosphoheptulonate synthase [Bradyrhizobium sp.]MBU6457887.1 3-deoxy-7-phosphoheptulonate synthase [Bradyrhizobium sp.]MDE2329844.1 3-deoxy-7-phosphoheptulonate synthase [Bradyrhizobium sp.]MDE2603658.1 3-deoxy-7-phosphoheptulonate synthase [Bradyrhizobium sp.]
MTPSTDDIRIREIKALISPRRVISEFPQTQASSATVADSRTALSDIVHHADDRLAVVVGPCSIHDPLAAMEYAERLRAVRNRLSDELEIVMRVYFAKPRTTIGWKGLINDPDLDGSFNIDDGLRIARKLLRDVNQLGLPAGSEFLDIVAPQYLSDLVAWGAIGARTTESQVHRELASGLSCPVGFKNGTDGKVRIAVDAVKAAAQPHHFMAVTKDGQSAIASTSGNGDCHIILRGGHAPNYQPAEVEAACRALEAAGLERCVMIDASHANSGYDPANQPAVVDAVAEQIGAGNPCIIGVMIESNLVGGRQTHVPGRPLCYGQSITDGCIDWETTVEALEMLARAVTLRRRTARTARRVVA